MAPLSDYLKIALDQVINRANRSYQGITPSTPRSLSAPLFLEIVPTLEDLPALIGARIPEKKLRTPLVVADPITWEIAGERIHHALKSIHWRTEHLSDIRSNAYSEVERVIARVIRSFPDLRTRGSNAYDRRVCGWKKKCVLYAVGGGTVIDVVKFAAKKLNLPWVSVPTNLANDAIASPYAVIDCDDPERDYPLGNHTFDAFVPVGVVVGLGTVLPHGEDDRTRYRSMLRSGVGEILSNLTATMDWELAARRGRDELDHVAFFTARSVAKDVLLDLQHGPDLEDPEFLGGVAAALLTSGAAMGRARSSKPASGFEHKLYHALVNRLRLPVRSSHGEIVGIASLISARMHGRYEEELRSACRAVGLPVTAPELEELGLTRDAFRQAIREAPAVKPERYTILEDAGIDAALEALDGALFPAARRAEESAAD
jgi:glycerol dehydrogenase-like iron-containing ADH family enzyme